MDGFKLALALRRVAAELALDSKTNEDISKSGMSMADVKAKLRLYTHNDQKAFL